MRAEMLNRDISFGDAEIKFLDNKSGKFEGYASVFNGVDSYGDTILPGAYKATLTNRKSPILMLYGHNPGRVIGKWSELREDERGLFVRGEFTPGNSDAQDVYANVKFEAVSGLSIGFMVPQGGADAKEDGGRYLKSIDLLEISIVSMPADDGARIGDIKNEIEALENLKDFEAFLRRDGVCPMSRNEAVAFVSRMKAILRSDCGEGEFERQLLEASATIAALESAIMAEAVAKFATLKS